MICSINYVLARIHSAWFSQDLVHDLQDKLWLEYDVTKQDTGLQYMIAMHANLCIINPGYEYEIQIQGILHGFHEICVVHIRQKISYIIITHNILHDVVYEHKGYILRLPQDIQYCMIRIVQIGADICSACHDFIRGYIIEYDDCCILLIYVIHPFPFLILFT